jgi:hypothetical protein
MALSLALSGCRSATEAPGDILEVTVEPSRTVLVRGDTMHITIRANNPTALDVTVSGSSSCLLAFHVLDGAGQVLAASDRVCTLDLSRATVPARGSLGRSLIWTGNEASGQGALAPVPSGEYRVVGVLNGAAGTQVSAPVTVEVRAP